MIMITKCKMIMKKYWKQFKNKRLIMNNLLKKKYSIRISIIIWMILNFLTMKMIRIYNLTNTII